MGIAQQTKYDTKNFYMTPPSFMTPKAAAPVKDDSKPDIRVDDTVEFTGRGKVTRIENVFGGQVYVLNTGLRTSEDMLNRGEVTHTLISRPKPKVGDTITGKDIRATQWKRGTILHRATAQIGGRTFMLLADGEWVISDTGNHVPFANFVSGLQYKVVHLPADR